MSARLAQSVVRRASRAWSRIDGSIDASARSAAISSPVPGRAPRSRIEAASSARRMETADPRSDTLEHAFLAHAVDVLADLEGRAKCAVEITVAECAKRLRPGD